MAKAFKAFRFPPELYEEYKVLVSRTGYTVTSSFEEFMRRCVEAKALVFPEAANVEDVEIQARVLLSWLKGDKAWYDRNGKEVSVPTTLLDLLPQIRDKTLKAEVEKTLKEFQS